MISERQQNILNLIIKEYIKTAEPVSSGVLASKYKLKASSATIRNDMMELEEAGYVYQPHTSSGRVPTKEAYELYIKNLPEMAINPKDKKVLDRAFKKDDSDLKAVAKSLTDLAGGYIFWGSHDDVHYSGLANLFSQPEFRAEELVGDCSAVIDNLEEIVTTLFSELDLGSQVFIGDENPFGDFLSAVVLKYKINGRQGVCGILGPVRMDYQKNLSLINYLQKKLLN
jgi:transcriptional regulator of heat shock response